MHGPHLTFEQARHASWRETSPSQPSAATVPCLPPILHFRAQHKKHIQRGLRRYTPSQLPMSASPVALRVFERVQSLLPPRFKHTWCMITVSNLNRLPTARSMAYASVRYGTGTERGAYSHQAAASTAAGHGPSWLPVIYREAVKDLGAPPSKDTISPLSWTLDHPRRRISRQLKETLLKSTILIGVGQCIEASFALGEALEEGDRDHVLVREGFDTDGKAMERGDTGLGRIYQHNILAIDRKMFELGLMDIRE